VIDDSRSNKAKAMFFVETSIMIIIYNCDLFIVQATGLERSSKR